MALPWSEVIDNIESFYNLTDDWDGAGTAAPDYGTINFALETVKHWASMGVYEVDSICISLNGTICLERRYDWCLIEIEFESPTCYDVRTVFLKGEPPPPSV